MQLNPERTSLTAAKVSHLCHEEQGVGVGCYGEINYLEYVYQEAERKRETPFGLPLPGHVHYQLGSCPNAEDAAKRTLLFSVHHTIDPESLRKQAQALKRTMERHK